MNDTNINTFDEGKTGDVIYVEGNGANQYNDGATLNTINNGPYEPASGEVCGFRKHSSGVWDQVGWSRAPHFLQGSKLWNPGTISAGDYAETTVTVTGATRNQHIPIDMHMEVAANDIQITATIQTSDTVHVIMKNQSGSNIAITDGGTVYVHCFGGGLVSTA